MRIPIHILYYKECPSYELAIQQLRQIITEEGINADITMTSITTEEQAQAVHFVGSPTILIHGHDIVPPPPDTPARLSCRAYHHEDGRISPLPSDQQIRMALIRAAHNQVQP
jgi:hypothetical protein